MDSIFFTDSVTIYRSTSSTSGLGGESVKTFTTHLTVSGSFQNASGDWSNKNDQEAFRKDKRFFCNVVDVLEGDKIRYNSVDYEVTNVSNMWGHHLEVDLQRRST
jgi:hypothetical protein